MSEKLAPERLAGLQRNYDEGYGCSREALGLLLAALSEIEKPGHVVLPVEDVQRLLSRAAFAADQLSAVAGDIEDGAPFRELRGKYVMALVDARDDLREALKPLRKHLEGQSR